MNAQHSQHPPVNRKAVALLLLASTATPSGAIAAADKYARREGVIDITNEEWIQAVRYVKAVAAAALVTGSNATTSALFIDGGRP